MTLSKRERYIAALALAALALFAADRYLLAPLLDSHARLRAERLVLASDIDRATNLLTRHEALARKWDEMVASGLSDEPSDAESQTLRALRNWAQDSGLALASLRPERATQGSDLQEESFQAAGSGPMKAVVQFLWQVEHSPLPLRIRELQLGLRKEGADDLSLQLRLSTIYLASSERRQAEAAVPPPQGGEGE